MVLASPVPVALPLHDASQPGRKRVRLTQRPDVLPRGDKPFLRGVLRQVAFTQEA